jgi:hypothetical protein
MTWEEIERKNLTAAKVILSRLEEFGRDSGLGGWALLYVARHPESSPITPPDRQPEFELT